MYGCVCTSKRYESYTAIAVFNCRPFEADDVVCRKDKESKLFFFQSQFFPDFFRFISIIWPMNKKKSVKKSPQNK